jgi:hypothetical protein
MVLPNPWYTGNNSSESFQVPNQNLLKNLLLELKLRRQIIGKLFKSLDKKKLLNNGMEKRSSCRSENEQGGVHTIRIQDILH